MVRHSEVVQLGDPQAQAHPTDSAPGGEGEGGREIREKEGEADNSEKKREPTRRPEEPNAEKHDRARSVIEASSSWAPLCSTMMSIKRKHDAELDFNNQALQYPFPPRVQKKKKSGR